MNACLVKPFVEAAQADKRRSLRAMSQAWISYLANIQVTSGDLNVCTLGMLKIAGLCSPAKLTPVSCVMTIWMGMQRHDNGTFSPCCMKS